MIASKELSILMGHRHNDQLHWLLLVRAMVDEVDENLSLSFGGFQTIKLKLESLILAQNERWRQVLYMQVEREPLFGGQKVANG